MPITLCSESGVRLIRALPAVCLLLAACLTTDTDPATDGDRPPLKLTEPPAEFPTAFTVIRAVMALPDGRLVVSDPQENRLALIDFAKGTSRQLGRVGDGPREFRRAGGLYRAPGGGLLVFDYDLRRLLPVVPSGALGDVIGLPTGGAATSWAPRGPDPLAIDSLGHTFAAIRSGGFTAPTSVLLRFRPGALPDTVTRLRRPATLAFGNGGHGTEYQEVLFSPEDAWTVSPDGRIAVVRAEPYRVEWFPMAGPAVAGPVIRHQPVPITPEEKERIASGAAGSRGRISVTVGMVPPGGSPPPSSGRPAPMSPEKLAFAEVKTPVNLRSGRWPLLDERGRLWVERNLPAGAGASVFDVFDRDGNLVSRVSLPAGVRLVGFDRQWLYAARLSSDDFEYLQRFPIPP